MTAQSLKSVGSSRIQPNDLFCGRRFLARFKGAGFGVPHCLHERSRSSDFDHIDGTPGWLRLRDFVIRPGHSPIEQDDAPPRQDTQGNDS